MAWIDWHVAERPIPGEAVSGDTYAVRETPNGVLVAVIDGLGHGLEAARTARQASEILRESPDESLEALFQRCDVALRSMRGAVMSAAFVNRADGRLSWLGVGNVEAVLVRADRTALKVHECLFLWPGVLGEHMRSVRASALALCPDDLLVFATDGIRGSFVESLSALDPPERVATQVMATYGKSTDDALVLAARYLGGSP